MKCSQARKYLSAFVDNELDVATNIEVLEHVEMCQGCAEQMEAHKRLKDAVASYVSSVKAPAGLRSRISQRLSTAVANARSAYALWRETLRSPWFRIVASAASILAVFTLAFWQLQTPPAGLNQDTVSAHVAVLRDQVPAFFFTSDAGRATRLALFWANRKPAVPLIGSEDFELVGAGPAEIESRNVGHFALRYRAVTLSMFVFEGLPLNMVGGREVETGRGLGKVEKRGDMSILAWRNGAFTYILVGRISADELIKKLGPVPVGK